MSRSRKKKRASFAGGFVAHSLDLRTSQAWRHLPDTALRVLLRIEEEHMRHGGAANGELVVTFDDFAKAGIRRASVALAIRQCVALGFLEITRVGRRNISDVRIPSHYRLTYVAARESSPGEAFTNEWKRIATAEDAQRALQLASDTRRYEGQPPIQRAAA